MKKLYDHKEDFEAKIKIFTKEEGGRNTPPKNGIRWDFLYEEDNPENGIYMIWPEFIDENGDAIPDEIWLEGEYDVRMHILMHELIDEHHKPRMKVGTKFYCMEGGRKVAKGTITKILWSI